MWDCDLGIRGSMDSKWERPEKGRGTSVDKCLDLRCRRVPEDWSFHCRLLPVRTFFPSHYHNFMLTTVKLIRFIQHALCYFIALLAVAVGGNEPQLPVASPTRVLRRLPHLVYWPGSSSTGHCPILRK